jgi:hypothetical protein
MAVETNNYGALMKLLEAKKIVHSRSPQIAHLQEDI